MLRTKRARAALALAGVAMLAIACSTGTPAEPAGITGKVTAVTRPTDPSVARLTILVEGGDQPAGAVSDKASCAVTDNTTIRRENGDAATADDLKLGTSVRVWFTGPVAESYPVQGEASYVEILGD